MLIFELNRLLTSITQKTLISESNFASLFRALLSLSRNGSRPSLASRSSLDRCTLHEKTFWRACTDLSVLVALFQAIFFKSPKLKCEIAFISKSAFSICSSTVLTPSFFYDPQKSDPL